MLLNLLLASLLGAAVWQLRERWVETRLRHEAQLKRLVPEPPAPQVPLVEGVKPVDAPAYSDVAMKMVFSKDRNPNVIIDEVPPPKPDPVPDFPAVYGVMEIGGPITVFMTDGISKSQKGYRPGEQVGPFKLVSATRTELVLEWKDKRFNKTIAELKPKPGEQAAAEPAPAAANPALAQLPRTPAGPQQPIEKLQQGLIKDGMIDTGAVNRACMAGDNSPAGTVQAGYRKVVRTTMFGQACYWEPVR